MSTIRIDSPSGTKSIFLAHKGDVHFGPSYFTISAKGFHLPLPYGTVVGEATWTPDELAIVATVFHTLGPPADPDVELVRIVVSSGVVQTLTREPEVIEIVSVDNTHAIALVGDRQLTFNYP